MAVAKHALKIDIVIFILFLTLYVATLAPTVLPADSGEFQIVGPLLGVAHPPGYALFTLLARFFSLLPWGEVAWRVNLLGAVAGALTLTIVNRTARRIAQTAWAGVLAAGALGVSTTFWAQSTTINIRMLTMLFMALCCHFLIEFTLAPAASKRGHAALVALGLTFGSGVAHHTSLAFFTPLFAAIILWHDPGLWRRFRVWPRYLLAFLAPFTIDLYIVIRAITGAPFGADALIDARRVLDHLLMRGFGGDMFAYRQPNRFLWERFLVTGNSLTFQFGWTLLLIAAAGWAWLAWKRRKWAVLMGGIVAIMLLIVATYRAPQSVEYLMPAYIPIALCIGSITAWTNWPRLPARHLALLPVALVALPILALGKDNLVSYNILHNDRTARNYAQNVLDQAPPNALILSNWHWSTPLWYLQLVQGQRPDVEIEYIPPQGATDMPHAWPQIIAQHLAASARPLIVTNYYPTYIDLPYRFEPLGEAFLVKDKPAWSLPPGFTPVNVELDDKIRIAGYRLEQTAAEPGHSVTIDIAWQPITRLERDYSFFVHLIDQAGAPLGQNDRRDYAAPTYQPGEILIDRYEFPIVLHAAPGIYQLVAGAYLTFDDGTWQRLKTGAGRDLVPLTQIQINPASLPPVTQHPLNVSFVDGPTLIGVDYDDTWPGQRRVYLHWQTSPQNTVVQLYNREQCLAQGTVSGSEQKGFITTVLDLGSASGAKNLDLVLAARDGKTPLKRRIAWGWSSKRAQTLPMPKGQSWYLPFGGKLALVGVEVQKQWRAGRQARVALKFIGLRPIVRDYVISISVHGTNAVIPPSDWVPALGAIPTFKWVRASRVTDVHLIDLPPEAGGKAEIALGIYDAFANHRALLPLDERLMRLGRTTVALQTVVIQNHD